MTRAVSFVGWTRSAMSVFTELIFVAHRRPDGDALPRLPLLANGHADAIKICADALVDLDNLVQRIRYLAGHTRVSAGMRSAKSPFFRPMRMFNNCFVSSVSVVGSAGIAPPDALLSQLSSAFSSIFRVA